MDVIRSAEEMRALSDAWGKAGARVGLVPTMGYFHDGHLRLIEAARRQCNRVVTSLFVNPMQFGPEEDFARYPRDVERDTSMAALAGSDVLFVPETEDIYPAGYRTFVEVHKTGQELEGKFRPTHFRGVATVVAKLLHIVRPQIAVFGQKDAQQLFIVRRMVKDLNFDVDVVDVPIVRESDGLAMSSRNVYLDPEARKNATALYRALKQGEDLVARGVRDIARIRDTMEETILGARPSQIDYVAFVDPETFEEVDSASSPAVLALLAVRFGKTRLIDNSLISVPKEH